MSILNTAKKAISILSKPEYLFLCIALPFCVLFTLAVPAGAGYDENFHICRIYELSHGNLFTDPIDNTSEETNEMEWGGVIDKSLYETIDQNWSVFRSHTQEDFDFPIWDDEAICSDKLLNEDYDIYAYGSAAIYSPVVYFPYIIAYLVGSVFLNNAYALVVFMRVIGIVFYCLVMFLCIRYVKFGKWILCCIALFPNTLCTFSTITADPVSFLGAILTVVLFLKLCEVDSINNKKLIALFTITCLTVCLSKVAYLPILALFLTLPIWNPFFRKWKNICPLLLIMFLCGLVFLVWYINTSNPTLTVGTTFGMNINPTEQMSFIISNPLSYVKIFITSLMAQEIFSFGGNGVANIYFSETGWLEVLIFCLACVMHDPREKAPSTISQRCGLFIIINLVIFAVITVLIFTALYLQFTPLMASMVSGVQARYFLPIIILLLLPISLLSYQTLQAKPSGLNCMKQISKRYLIILVFIDALMAIALIYMKMF